MPPTKDHSSLPEPLRALKKKLKPKSVEKKKKASSLVALSPPGSTNGMRTMLAAITAKLGAQSGEARRLRLRACACVAPTGSQGARWLSATTDSCKPGALAIARSLIPPCMHAGSLHGHTVVIQSPLARKSTGSDVRTCWRWSAIPCQGAVCSGQSCQETVYRM